MTKKSVNITIHDRSTITSNIKNHFLLVAEAKHTNKTFHKDITLKIFKRGVEKVKSNLDDNPLLNLLPYSYTANVLDNMNRVKLPSNLFIYDIPKDSYFKSLLIANDTLYALQPKDIKVDAALYKNQNEASDFIINFVSNDFMQEFITEDILDEIAQHNLKMEKIFTALNDQLTYILKHVDNSRTTKQFESKPELANLTNFYTPTIKRKLAEKKQEEQEAKTEEDEILAAAMASLATGKILASAKK